MADKAEEREREREKVCVCFGISRGSASSAERYLTERPLQTVRLQSRELHSIKASGMSHHICCYLPLSGCCAVSYPVRTGAQVVWFPTPVISTHTHTHATSVISEITPLYPSYCHRHHCNDTTALNGLLCVLKTDREKKS